MVVQWLENNIVSLKLWVNLMKMQQLPPFKCNSCECQMLKMCMNNLAMCQMLMLYNLQM